MTAFQGGSEAEEFDPKNLRSHVGKMVEKETGYGSVENMKFIEKQGWKFIIGAKENRQVSITKNIYVSISSLDWSKTLVQKVWLKEFGYEEPHLCFVRRFCYT